MRDFIQFIGIVIVAAVVVGILTIGAYTLIVKSQSDNPCWIERSFACKNARVNDCLNSEIYTREECIALIGGGDSK